MDQLRTGAAWLAGQLRASASSRVIYRRGTASATVLATAGQSMFESTDSNGVLEQWQSRDFIFSAGDFPYAEPLRGDKILEMIGGVANVFEVSSPRGVPLYRYGDAFRSTIRVHATRVGIDATVTAI
jgi:hypothetical protein